MRYAKHTLLLLSLLAILLILTPVSAADGEYQWEINESRANELSSRGGSTAIDALVTGYTCGPESTGKYPGDSNFCRTASGKVLAESDSFKAVAADNRYYAFGTKLYMEGIGIVTVVDTGGDIQGPSRFDLFVSLLDADLAYTWGSRRVRVWRLD